MNDRVRIDRDDDGVAHVRLNRADKLNALDGPMFQGLLAAGARLRTMPGLRAVVLSGLGRGFCAGLDMASFARMREPGDAADGSPRLSTLVERSHGIANMAQQVAWQWRELPVPVIAALHGVVFGGGLQIALGADLRYVTADARLSVLEIKWGLVPDMAGLPLMRDLLRDDVMRELVYSGRVVEGSEAATLGLATRVCADPLADAITMARRIAASSPDAIRAGKRLMNLTGEVDTATLLLAESVEQQALIGQPNQVEAVNAGLQQREPRFGEPMPPPDFELTRS